MTESASSTSSLRDNTQNFSWRASFASWLLPPFKTRFATLLKLLSGEGGLNSSFFSADSVSRSDTRAGWTYEFDS